MEKSKEFQFFAVIPPGLESLAAKEFSYWAPAVTHQTGKGGLTWSSEVAQAVQLQAQLKIPARILVRVDEVAARDFPKWYKKVAKVQWNEFLAPGQGISVDSANITVHASRLKIRKRVAQTMAESFTDHFPVDAEIFQPSVWVRFEKNIATISLDLSGELLYQRGQREWVGAAPIRENLAAACLWALVDLSAQSKRALLDPMAGSGVFLSEAQGLLKPHWRKQGFAVEGMPKLFRHEMRAAIDQSERSSSPWSRLLAVEPHPQALRALRHNVSNIDVIESDFQSATVESDGPVDIIANAPYGVRVKPQGGPSDNLEKWYMWMLQKLAENYRPERIAVVMPRNLYGKYLNPQKLTSPNGLDPIVAAQFQNGGIPVQLVIWS